MFDADSLAGMAVWPSCHVARSKNAWHARFKKLVDQDAANHRQAGTCARSTGPYSDSHHHEVGVGRLAVAQRDGAPRIDVTVSPKMEHDAVRLVQRSNEPTDLRADNPLEWQLLRRDDVDRKPSRPQRSGHLETDKAGANDDHMSCVLVRSTMARPSAKERR